MPEACLHLQNQHDLDVNLVLFAAFVGAERSQRLTSTNLEAARDRVDTWHREVVRPLRAVRQRLKTGPTPAPGETTAHLRRKLQQIEIEAELIELDELGSFFSGRAPIPGWDPAPASGSAAESAAAAIETVVQACSHAPIDDRDRHAIGTIAGAAALTIRS